MCHLSHPLIIIPNYSVSICCINEIYVYHAQENLKPKITTGIDRFPSSVLKEDTQALLHKMHFIFNLIINCSYPTKWKCARIRLKKIEIKRCKKLLSISILSNLAKSFEKGIYDEIFQQFKNHINSQQHHFFSRRSPLSNLTCFLQFMHTNLNKMTLYIPISPKLLIKLTIQSFCLKWHVLIRIF